MIAMAQYQTSKSVSHDIICPVSFHSIWNHIFFMYTVLRAYEVVPPVCERCACCLLMLFSKIYDHIFPRDWVHTYLHAHTRWRERERDVIKCSVLKTKGAPFVGGASNEILCSLFDNLGYGVEPYWRKMCPIACIMSGDIWALTIFC